MKDKESFVFHRDWYTALKYLENDVRLEVYDSIMHNVFDGEKIEISPLASVAMSFILPQLERDIEKYNSICERRKAFGSKGGVAKATKSKQKLPKASKSKQKVASVADNDNDNDIQESKDSMSIEKKEDTNVSPKKKKFDVWEDLSYVDENHYAIWYEWLQYKGEIKKQYSTLTGAKKAYTHWLNLSAGDLEKARAIIDQSIMRNWDGLFDVRDYKPKEEVRQSFDEPQQQKWQF